MLGRCFVIIRHGPRTPIRGLPKVGVDTFVFHRFVVLRIHDDVCLAGAQQRLAADSEGEFGDFRFVDESLACGVGAEASEKPVAVVFVDVVKVLGEGTALDC